MRQAVKRGWVYFSEVKTIPEARLAAARVVKIRSVS